MSTPSVAPKASARSDVRYNSCGQTTTMSLCVKTYTSESTYRINKKRRAELRFRDISGLHVIQETDFVHKRDTKTVIVSEKG
jgi:hypothetical protein